MDHRMKADLHWYLSLGFNTTSSSLSPSSLLYPVLHVLLVATESHGVLLLAVLHSPLGGHLSIRIAMDSSSCCIDIP